MKRIFNSIVPALIFSLAVKAQDPIDDLLNNMQTNQVNYTTNTFKASRIMDGHSVEQPAVGELEFRISHRFGRLNEGAYEIWGLDEANMHFSLEYSPLNRFTIGLGRSTWKKTYDGYAKVAILKQQTGKRVIPVSVSCFSSIEAYTLKNEIDNFEWYHRLSYTQQVMIARKFNKILSLQISPTYVHKNLTKIPESKNDIPALGLGGRFKITKRLSVNAETFLVRKGTQPADITYYNPITVGIDLETGGHVFQILLTNALPMRETGFITETTGSWAKGDIHLGFNISRMFNLYNH